MGNNGSRQRKHPPLRIAFVGDVHDQWTHEDESALRHLQVDVAIFVGDFGNENVELVRAIAATRTGRAVIMGNHDAWFTATESGKKRAKYQRRNGNYVRESNVDAQLKALGDLHIGYECKTFARDKLAVVGARPFSKGGNRWADVADFYSTMYDIGSSEESCSRIVAAGRAAPKDSTIVMVGHNGPTGLGAATSDPCGVDWIGTGGDHGDDDMRSALVKLNHEKRPAALVAFGHMHEKLKNGGLRRRVDIDAASGAVYLNVAVVPRILSEDPQAGEPRGARSDPGLADVDPPGPPPPPNEGEAVGEGDVTLHHFTVAELQAGTVHMAKDVWVRVQHGAINRCSTAQEKPLLRTVQGDSPVRMLWNNFTGEWEPANPLLSIDRDWHGKTTKSAEAITA